LNIAKKKGLSKLSRSIEELDEQAIENNVK